MHGLETRDTVGRMTDIDSLWDYHNPAATEQRLRALLPEVERSGDLGLHVELLTQMARTHSMRRQFDQSHALLDQARELLGGDDEPVTSMPRARVRYLLERGRALNSAAKPQAA